jgi:hypothetical protein
MHGTVQISVKFGNNSKGAQTSDQTKTAGQAQSILVLKSHKVPISLPKTLDTYKYVNCSIFQMKQANTAFQMTAVLKHC